MNASNRFDVGPAIERTFRVWFGLLLPLTALNAAVMAPLAALVALGPVEALFRLERAPAIWRTIGAAAFSGVAVGAVRRRLVGEAAGWEGLRAGLRNLFPSFLPAVLLAVLAYGVRRRWDLTNLAELSSTTPVDAVVGILALAFLVVSV